MTESAYIETRWENDPSARLPKDMGTVVWRYLDDWKFESLIREQSLYLCRLDKLQDKFEGCYAYQQIADQEKWLRDIDYEALIETERSARARTRRNTFVNSWCVSEYDLDLMWRAYTSDTTSVAIRSTVERLVGVAKDAIDLWPIAVSMVEYIDHADGAHIDYPGLAVSLKKDIHFKLDREIRLVHTPNCTDPPSGVFLPVDLGKLIVEIVCHPQMESDRFASIQKCLREANVAIPVRQSRYIRPRRT